MENSDFDDDEDFGLSAPPAQEARPISTPASPIPQPIEEDEDIYGDIEEASNPAPATRDSTPGGSGLAAGQLALVEHQTAVVERQNSGQLAESKAAPPHKAATRNKTAGSKAQLPKRLADTTVVYVGELQWWTSDAQIESICQEFGTIQSITFFEEKGSGKSKGYALVEFADKEAANLCRQQMHGMEINSRKCVVTFSSNSNAATAAARAGARQDAKVEKPKPPPSSSSMGGNKGPPPPGPGRGWGMPGWGMGGVPMPVMPPWGAAPMMGMGGLPMPGMGMPPFMGMMGPQNPGNDGRDFKRKRY